MCERFRSSDICVFGALSLNSLDLRQRDKLLEWVRTEYAPSQVFEHELEDWATANGWVREADDD